MEILLSIILGLAVGIISSFMFWGGQRLVKPSVSIASKIAITKDEKTGKRAYRFKVRNNGKNQVVDITFKAWICELSSVPGGNISSGVEIFPINNSNTVTLAPCGKSERPWGLTEETTFRSLPNFDVEDMLADTNRKIMVTMRCSDSVSGTTVVQQKIFTAEDIKEGQFEFGQGMEIKNI